MLAETDAKLEKNTDEKKDVRLYELGYHLLSTIAEEDIAEEAGGIKDVIEKHGGAILADRMPRQISLAYSIPQRKGQKRKYFDTALFGWIKFHISPAHALELNDKLKHNEIILRYILIRTIQEKAQSTKQMTFLKQKPGKVRRPTKRQEPPKVLSEEELDKAVEELIT